jgi:hypothetical protein
VALESSACFSAAFLTFTRKGVSFEILKPITMSFLGAAEVAAGAAEVAADAADEDTAGADAWDAVDGEALLPQPASNITNETTTSTRDKYLFTRFPPLFF